jgi:hypothetical protein
LDDFLINPIIKTIKEIAKNIPPTKIRNINIKLSSIPGCIQGSNATKVANLV